MARRPKPWWRKERKAWFVTIDGKQHNLGPNRPEAMQRFHTLMARRNQRRTAASAVVALYDRFPEWTQKHRATDTYEWYRQRLQLFAAHIGPGTRVVGLRPFHVQEFIDAMPHSNGTKPTDRPEPLANVNFFVFVKSNREKT